MIEVNKLYNEDCIDTLFKIESNSIDCIITDPPYSGLNSKSKGKGRFSIDNYHIQNDDMSERAFLIFMKPILKEIYRVLKVGSHFYCFSDWKQLRNMADIIEVSGFKIKNIICWNKVSFGTGAGYRSQSEYILVFSKSLSNTFFLKNVGNVLSFKRVKNKSHPHQKPIDLLNILIKNSTKENDLIYDPFSGSASTLIACKNLNRRFIGSELSKEYFKNAIKYLYE